MARLVISFSLLSVITVGIVAYITYTQARQTLTQSIFDQLEAAAILKQDELNRWVKDQRRTVDWLSQLPDIHQYADVLSQLEESDPDYDSAYKNLSEYLANMVVTQPDLQEVFILVGDEGKIIVSTDKTHKGQVIAPTDQEQKRNDNYYEKASQGRKVVQNVYPSPFTDEPTLTIAMPLITQAGKRVGVLAAHLNLARMDRIILEHTGLGETSETYLVDEDGSFVTAERFGRDEYPDRVHSQGIDAAITGQSGADLYENYKGVPVIGVYHWIKDRDLALLTEIHQSEAFEPARQLARTILKFGLVSAGVLALGVFLLARQIARPILAITETAQRVTAGDLTCTAPVMTEDELGVLANAFNAMQVGLRQSHLQLEQYAHTLEQRVGERTAELQAANAILSQRALQLETSSEVGRQITSTLKLNKLLNLVVNLIQDRFGYFFVGVWLLNEQGDYADLGAGTGQTGQKNKGARISIDTPSVIASVCNTGQSRVVDDVSQAPDYLSLSRPVQVRSELALPLLMGEQVLGVLDIESDQLAAFVPDDVMVLQMLADQIAIAIRNARLYLLEQRRRHLAESLEQIGRTLASSLDLSQVPARVLAQLAIVVPFERGSILLQNNNELHIIAQHGFPDAKRTKNLQVPIRPGDIFEQMTSSRGPLLIDDVTQEPGWQQVEWLPINHSFLGVPLVSQNRAIGMISLLRHEVAAFSPDEATLVMAFAGQAAIAIENARLYDRLEEMVQARTKALQQACDELEGLERTRSNFISTSSHELRTPITVLRGYTQMLLEDPKVRTNAHLEKLVQGILCGTLRLHDIVDNMLEIARIDSSELDVQLELLPIAELVAQIVQHDLAQALIQRRLTCEMQNLDVLEPVDADHENLYKVFYHLIVNAIKYTPDGGRITISGRNLQFGEYGLSGSGIKVTVSDTGIGIAPEFQRLVFVKFYQTGQLGLHSTGKTKFKGGGAGLGLAIVKGVVKAHGGKIWVESDGYDEQGCPGSQFHVVLPLRQIKRDVI